jgi:hypothetical protein
MRTVRSVPGGTVRRPARERPRRMNRTRGRTSRPRSVQQLVLALDARERDAVLDLLRDELASGWIPKVADLEAALEVVRSVEPARARAERPYDDR